MQTPLKNKAAEFWNWVFSLVKKPVPIPVEEPQKEEQKPLYRYNCKIYTGAGIVKVGTDAYDGKDARERVLLDYIKRLNIKVELVHAYKPKPQTDESGTEQQSGTTEHL